ncbi:MAG: DMT family transporter [Inquilinus sp.]|nr:DMT family transporter [Inquilinus sp.]
MGAASLSAVHAPLRGALWMVAAGACFAIGNSLLRHLTTGSLHPYQVAFLQYGIALLLLLPWVLLRGGASYRTRRPFLQAIRVVAAAIGVLFLTLAFRELPVAEVVALTFTAPLFATLGAAPFLGERVGWRRWAATGVGFLGVLVILRPGLETFRLEALLPLAAALFFAASSLIVKRLSATETADSIVLYLLVLMTPILLVPALPVWQAPTAAHALPLAALGLSAAAAQLALVRAFAAADASFLGPFDFARLPFSALVAFVAFGEAPDRVLWIGAAFIVTAALYLAHEESRPG